MDGKLYGLDLFSGIGGITLALSQFVKPIAYCENDSYAQAVLVSRMLEGAIPRAPIWDDVCTLRKADLYTGVDIIYGGFPCQDISVAGTGKGLEGERSGLFYEIIRLTKEIRPSFVFLENVPAIRTRGLRDVVRAFTNLRYDCRWTSVSAAEVGAPHIRKRWFLLGYSKHNGFYGSENSRSDGKTFDAGCSGGENSIRESERTSGLSSHVAHTNSDRVRDEQQRQSRGLSNGICDEGKIESQFDSAEGRWATEPDVGRVVNGLPYRVERIKCLGNAVVPKQAEEAFKKLMGLK